MSTKMSRKRKLIAAGALVTAVVVAAGCMYACAPKANPGLPKITVESPESVPEADSFGIITAESWKDIYPNQYNSYLQNVKNVPYDYEAETAKAPDMTTIGLDLLNGDFSASKEKVSYLDTNPEILTMGKGYGYAKYYTEPGGHNYSLYTVEHNGRISEKTKMSCYACKTPQYYMDEAKYGEAQYQRPFSEGDYTENISCANCHVNDNPTQLNVLRPDWVRAMGSDSSKVPMQSQVCGQCHCDYSMSPVNGEPTSPYSGGVDSMMPDKALAWYDANNYADWTYESTGAKMISVRHAEFEFIYAGEGSHMAQLGYTCADCHMGTAVDSNGNAYSNHTLTNPTQNETLIKENCSTCHKDIKAEVAAWQADIDGRTTVLGKRCEQFVKNFENAINANSITDDQKAKLQTLQRSSAYYWNLAAAENSEGAHNPSLYNLCLDKGNQLLDEADGILGVSSKA
ncbi:MAG: ammonia-forming cytochrome c nitrite reductase subunit c552 [Coriobacteriia bacterium]|nr:ammonia-forming cytochrome c nitrite reductase subunit c552 [Coriobacteriia bacterium]